MNFNDFIEIKEYHKKAGQSGKLGVTIDKNGKKYLLKKGEYGEPANEYVYSLVAQKVGVSCQICQLVAGFGVPVVAFEYIEAMSKEDKENFDHDLIVVDEIKALALDAITDQDDNFQYIISEEGEFYKIDNSCAFGFERFTELLLEKQSKKDSEAFLQTIENNADRIISMINIAKDYVVKNYGDERVDVFDSVLRKFLETDFSFLANDKRLSAVYKKDTYRYFLAKTTAMKKAIENYFDCKS